MRNQPETSNFAPTRTPISQEALGQLFYDARTYSSWLPEAVPVELLRKARLAPTSANGSPA
jgi:3-hydroxypropanoate dehydrogenase